MLLSIKQDVWDILKWFSPTGKIILLRYFTTTAEDFFSHIDCFYIMLTSFFCDALLAGILLPLDVDQNDLYQFHSRQWIICCSYFVDIVSICHCEKFCSEKQLSLLPLIRKRLGVGDRHLVIVTNACKVYLHKEDSLPCNTWKTRLKKRSFTD